MSAASAAEREPVPSDATPHPRTAAGRRGLLLPLLLLVLTVLLFLAEPILRYPSAHYCFADFIQSFSLITMEPGRPPTNRFMGDPAVIYHPWTIFNHESARAGELPVWNPYNGGGVPHLANYQSGVFSPYNLPFYLLDFKTALLASAFLKLFAIAAFTFLFLRACGLARAAAALGATAYTFAGYHVVWVSGAITATAATLPAALYFAEIVLQRAEGAGRTAGPARLAPPLAGLALSLAAGLLAGHPENVYSGGLLLTAYLGFRLWRLRRALPLADLAGLGGRFAVCALAAVLVSSIQLLPFAEYLLHSEVIVGRSGLTAGLASRPMHLWSLFLVPQVLGNWVAAHPAVASLPMAFPETIAPYAGAVVLCLAALSVFLWRASGRVRFFLVVMGLWLIFTFDPLGVAVAFRLIPGMSHLPITRTHDIWLFAVSAAAAWLVDALIRRRAERPPLRFLAAAGGGVLAVGLLGSRRLIERYQADIAVAGPESMAFVKEQLLFFAWTTALGVAAFVVIAVATPVVLRRAGAVALVAVAFLQTGFLFREFNPTIEDRLVYPVTEEMRTLQRVIGRDTLVIAGGTTRSLIADSNVVYGLSLPNNYDGIWIRRYDFLYRRRFGGGSFPRTPNRFDPLGLKLFGVDYVLGQGALVNTALVDQRGMHFQATRLPPLQRGGTVQTFGATEENLQGVEVYAVCPGDLTAGALSLSLETAPELVVVAERTIPCTEIGTAPQWVALTFPPIANSKGGRYRIVAAPVLTGPGGRVALHTWEGFDYQSGMFALEGARQETTLAFDFSYDLDAFQPLSKLKDRQLYRFLGGRSRYYTVGRAIAAADDDAALALVEAPGFDPMEAVVLTEPPGPLDSAGGSGDQGTVEIVSEAATRIELDVSRSHPGHLVLAKPHYPGWKASVDGVDRPLLRANYAFMAVEVPAGTSRVTVRYEPASVRWGAMLSLATLLVGGVWLGWSSRQRR